MNISQSENLRFKKEDATQLSYKDNRFDLTYSISVIEHIYENYEKALREMIRVTKPGGLVYVTFPVAPQYDEEWVDDEIPWKGTNREGKNFFQYVFDKERTAHIVEAIQEGCEIVEHNHFFEKHPEGFNRFIEYLKKEKPFNIVRNALANARCGLFEFSEGSESFDETKRGITCILAKKKM
jgi:ubiquinone/menaquinone biosynthesis C-methylase UbiE